MDFGIGIIGATGYIGVPYRAEIRAARTGDQIVALCARRQERLQAAAAEDGAQLATKDWHDVVEHPDVNLVLVLTPDALHYEPVMACARLGKHVFCEKPVGKDLAEARTMWQAVREAGLAHYVPYWTRYVPAFRRAKQLVEEGRLGDVRAIVYRWHNPRPPAMPFTWRDDAQLSTAGSLADVGSHAYDTLRFLLGQEARRVLAHTDVLMPPKPDLGAIDLSEALAWGNDHCKSDSPRSKRAQVPDYAQLAIEFPDGLIGAVTLSHASYLRKGFAPEVELHGTAGSLSIDRLTGELWFADSPEPARRLETVKQEAEPNRFQEFVFPALRERLETQSDDHPGMHDGWRVQLFTEAAMASAARGEWVALAELDQDT